MRRSLSCSEIQEANRVFRDTVPYDRVMLDQLIAAPNSYTTVDAGVPLFSSNHYYIHVGPTGFAGMLSSLYWRRALIHNLTHVWQGEHGLGGPITVSWLFRRATELATGPLLPALGALWENLTAEQQANAVEQWYATGMQTSSPLYGYILKIRAAPKSYHNWLPGDDLAGQGTTSTHLLAQN